MPNNETSDHPLYQSVTSKIKTPPYRLPLRENFPEVIMATSLRKVQKPLEKELAKIGRTLKDAGRIYIAYPHKHPELFPKHRNDGTVEAKFVQDELRENFPEIEWTTVDSLCEAVHLNRSDNKGCIHALTKRHTYAINGDTPEINGNLFIISDHALGRGTTIANLASLIHFHGGYVLCALAPEDIAVDVVYKTRSLISAFNKKASLTNPTHNLARQFQKYAVGELRGLPEEDYITLLEKALNRHGHSVTSLTQGECNAIFEYIRPAGDGNFNYLIKELNEIEPEPGVITPPHALKL